MERTPIQKATSSDGKTIAIIAYLTIIGLVAAIIMNNKEKTALAQFHIRQSIGISVTGMALGLLRFVPGIGGIAISIVGLLLLIALILGLMSAFAGERKPLPFIGEKYQEWFSMI